jgi:hypothetical protein
VRPRRSGEFKARAKQYFNEFRARQRKADVSESSISVLRMTSQAAGAFRRTQIERSDQRVAWKRTDQAFFAAGACHVLAWVCREAFPARSIGIAAVRFESEQQVFHTYATWNGWAFDHSGWNPEPELLAVNTDFEGRPLELRP